MKTISKFILTVAIGGVLAVISYAMPPSKMTAPDVPRREVFLQSDGSVPVHNDPALQRPPNWLAAPAPDATAAMKCAYMSDPSSVSSKTTKWIRCTPEMAKTDPRCQRLCN